MGKRRTLPKVFRLQKEHAAIETFHALTPVARPDQRTNDNADQHAIAPVASPTLEPEPTEPGDLPATIVNRTIEELAREGARRMLKRATAVEVDEFLGRPRYERRNAGRARLPQRLWPTTVRGHRHLAGRGSARRASATWRMMSHPSTARSCPAGGPIVTAAEAASRAKCASIRGEDSNLPLPLVISSTLRAGNEQVSFRLHVLQSDHLHARRNEVASDGAWDEYLRHRLPPFGSSYILPVDGPRYCTSASRFANSEGRRG